MKFFFNAKKSETSWFRLVRVRVRSCMSMFNSLFCKITQAVLMPKQ